MVAPLNEVDARQLYAVRAVLDGLAARDACACWTEADAAELRRLVSHMELLADHPADVQRLGWEFHQVIRRVAGNGRCAALLEDMGAHFDRYRTLTTQRPGRRREAINEHTGILHAILDRDEDLAERLMREHILSGLAASRTSPNNPRKAAMDLGLTDRVAVVAGGTAGLGLATARALAAEGAKVVIGGRRAEVARAEAAALPAALGVGVDLTDPDGPRALVDAAVTEFGPVDVLILNGGGPTFGAATELTPEAAAAAVDLLVLPQMRLVEAALPGMRERRWGRVVGIGSSGVQQPIPSLAASNVGRAALAGYLKTLSAEVAADGVTVNLVLPGRIDTDRVVALDQSNATKQGKDIAEVRAASQANIPVGRYGTPEEFAAVVTFIASEAASYVTGTQIRCDGGLVKAH